MQIVKALIRWIARTGYTARGLVYLAVGGLAIEAAFDLEEADDIRGAMNVMVQQQYGEPVLFAIAIGLVAYSAWRLVQSLLDIDGHGFSLQGLGVRAALLISAGMHIGLALASAKIALHIASEEDAPTQSLVAGIFSWPMGSWIVVVGGALVGVAGAAHIYKGATGGFRRWFDASPAAMRWIDPISRFGLIARGLLFVFVCIFVVQAAFTLEAEDARGLEGVLIWVQALPLGRFWLGLAGLGLFAFGVYSMIEAFVRQVGLAKPENR